jgi:hypothetical protein
LMWMVMEVSGQFALLTKINYTDWSSMMHVMLHAHGLWTTVKEGTTDEVKDQMPMEALLRAVPLEMTSSLVSKPFMKAAWDLLESARLGYDRARMSSVHRVRWQYENVSFLDGESLDDFALCLGKMVHELEILGDPEESRKVAAKYLCIVPKKFIPVIVSIESLLDTTTMSIEKITGQLWVVEGCSDDEDTDPPTSAGGKLLLTEEKWQACMKEKQAGDEGSSKSVPSKGGPKSHPRGHQKKKNSGGKDDRDTCLNCGKKGHWAKDCRVPQKEKANLTKEDDEESLLMA